MLSAEGCDASHLITIRSCYFAGGETPIAQNHVRKRAWGGGQETRVQFVYGPNRTKLFYDEPFIMMVCTSSNAGIACETA